MERSDQQKYRVTLEPVEFRNDGTQSILTVMVSETLTEVLPS